MTWKTPPKLWRKLAPHTRDMRTVPTATENLLWQRLRRKQLDGYRFRRQHPVGRFVVDFYCAEARLVIEVDGPVHESQRTEDAIRHAWLEQQGIRVLHVAAGDVARDTDAVVEIVRTALRGAMHGE